MTTQKALLEEHRQGLDTAYRQKYPIGRFTLQIWRVEGILYGLHWNPRRRTSHVSYKGISTSSKDVSACSSPGILQETYQSCAFGHCNHYNSLDKMLLACTRSNVPEDVIKAFVDRYNNRASEGFSC